MHFEFGSTVDVQDHHHVTLLHAHDRSRKDVARAQTFRQLRRYQDVAGANSDSQWLRAIDPGEWDLEVECSLADTTGHRSLFRMAGDKCGLKDIFETRQLRDALQFRPVQNVVWRTLGQDFSA